LTSVRSDYHKLVRRDVFELIPKSGGVLLDIGGGVGATAAALKAEGYAGRVGVIDLVAANELAEGVDFAMSGDLDHPDFLDALYEREGAFDTILCLDILEHLKDPWSLVARLHACLAPGGSIVASIPNVRNYQLIVPLVFCGRFTLADSGILDRTHLRWFVRDSAIELMTSSGLNLDKIIDKPKSGRKVALFDFLTLRLFRRFTEIQYLIRVVRH